MLRNYLTIARRNLLKNKGFTVINVSGLALGLTCCFLILLFVRHELSYDSFHERADRIYRVSYLPKFAGLTQPLSLTPPPASPLLVDYFSEIETSARVYRSSATLEAPSRRGAAPAKYDEERFFFADSTLLRIFSFQFLQGNPRTALNDKFGVVLTEQTATRYFGSGNALGKTLRYEGRYAFHVTGVVKDFPANSHIHPDLLANFETMFATESEVARENLPQNWIISHSYTYVLLRPGRSAEAVNARFPQFLLTHADKDFAKDIVYQLQPLRAIHLDPSVAEGPEPIGSLTYLYVFIAIAVLTLLIACINFVNLSTARSLKRAKEVGIRKVLGSERAQLVGQFLSESVLLSGLAFLLSLGLVATLLPVLNGLTDKALTVDSLTSDGPLLLSFVGIALATGLLSGSYPAFFVSGFQPIATLKGPVLSAKAGGGALRQVLLGAQFVASVALIIGALVAFRQFQFLQNQPMGFQKDLILTANTRNYKLTNLFVARTDSVYRRLKTFKEILLKNPRVRQVTLSAVAPGNGAVRRNVIPEGHTADERLFISTLNVDLNFPNTFGLRLVAGRDFSEAIETDKTAAFLLNESGVRQFGWKLPSEALGKLLDLEGKRGTVVGVLKDFHNQSLHNPIEPLVLTVDQPLLSLFSIKLQAQDLPQTLAFLRREWDAFFPEKGFDYEFLDQTLASQYDREQRLSRLIGYFAGLAVLISCLGLYGLVSLVTQQKTKEIGIRKVLGASVANIVALLSGGFARLVLVAILVASPLAWWGMNRWLQDFAYKIGIEWWVFVVAGALALGIALLTVSFQAIRAALLNPVKSLRTE